MIDLSPKISYLLPLDYSDKVDGWKMYVRPAEDDAEYEDDEDRPYLEPIITLSSEDYEALGSPSIIKVTIEAG